MAFLAKAQKADLLSPAAEAVTSARIQKEEKEREFVAKEKEKEKEIELFLKKMELEIEAKRIESTTEGRVKSPFDVCRLILKFDPKVGDINLYMTLFERQVKRAKVSEELWVSHLIGLLPNDMAQLIAREPDEVTDDYEQVKQILLKRYKFSAEMF
ncbi:hypothetical protein AVEN_135987-1 [Araneus ventricosus]|uniref:Uncharacterized protein n=1 Tax=Araneus ventricosus TaxID=182803 RepID=A0A4Y2LDC3_ARAVE|nr:hypothetical protein AVEN_135987-1 [Araneus ventricosus]